MTRATQAMHICCVTADLSDDDLDLPSEPGIILRGTVASVKLSAMLWGEPVDVVAVHDLAHRENLIRRAHDAMGRRDPDGIVTDNRLENLRWATPSENNQDKIEHGTHQSGDRAGTAKLTWDDAARIRAKRLAGQSVRSVASEFGVCRNTITNITTGRTWIAPCRKRLERAEDYL